MRRALALALAAALLSACVAVTVERHKPRRGPVKEVGYIDYGGGQVRYSSEGWAWVVASRRKTALKLMSRNCGPDLEPAITDEYSRQDADAAYNGSDIDAVTMGDQHFLIEHYVHLAYECRPKGAAAPAVSTTTARGPVLVIPQVPVSTTTAAVELSTAPAVAVSSAPAVSPELSSSTAVVPAASSSTAVVPAASSSTFAAPEPPK
jgi:hypothetical protein